MTRGALHRFDLQRLLATLDAERQARGLSWVRLTTEINKPFAGTSSIPVSLATIRGIGSKSSVTSAVVLQILRWLRRTPESFLAAGEVAPQAEETLPDPGPLRILRTRALHTALDAERRKRG